MGAPPKSWTWCLLLTLLVTAVVPTGGEDTPRELITDEHEEGAFAELLIDEQQGQGAYQFVVGQLSGGVELRKAEYATVAEALKACDELSDCACLGAGWPTSSSEKLEFTLRSGDCTVLGESGWIGYLRLAPHARGYDFSYHLEADSHDPTSAVLAESMRDAMNRCDASSDCVGMSPTGGSAGGGGTQRFELRNATASTAALTKLDTPSERYTKRAPLLVDVALFSLQAPATFTAQPGVPPLAHEFAELSMQPTFAAEPAALCARDPRCFAYTTTPHASTGIVARFFTRGGQFTYGTSAHGVSFSRDGYL